MSKGVKKIEYKSGKIDTKLSRKTKIIALANEPVVFCVTQWEAETTEAEKQKPVTWIWQTQLRKIVGKLLVPAGKNFRFTIPKHLCGAYPFYLEASLSGKTDVKEKGIYVMGSCEAIISKSQWSTAPKGLAITSPVSWGTNIFLEINTEGLNGFKGLTVEIYKKEGDKLIETTKTPTVVDGKTILEVKTTFWRIMQPTESFYVKIKHPNTGHYVHDANKNEKHGNIEIKNVFAPPTPSPPTNLSPYVIGKPNVNFSKIEPCQYTEIELKNPKGEKTILFKEDKSVKSTPVIHTGVIVGGQKNKSKQKFTLKVDDKSAMKQCFQKVKHTKQLTVHKPTPLNVEIIKDTGKELEFEAWFDYDKINLFDYFFLTKSKLDLLPNLLLKSSTCRYHHDIYIKPVPDVEWEVNFFYNTPDPVWFGSIAPTYGIYDVEKKHTRDIKPKELKTLADVKAMGTLVKEERDNNAAAKLGGKKSTNLYNNHFGNQLSNFGISAKVKYDNGKSEELSFKIAEKYRDTLGILKSIYDKVESLTGAKDAKTASENITQKSLIPRRNLMNLSLLPPAPSVGVSWKYATIPNGEIGIELKGKAKCVPLIGGELKIDLLALADKIPVYGKLITALDLMVWLAEAVSFNRLSLDYQINLTFYANLALEEAFISYNSAFKKGDRLSADLKISGTLGGKLELTTNLKVKVKTDVETGFEAGIKGDCYFKITASPNAKMDDMIDWKTEFSGLIVTGYYKFTSFKNTKKDKPNKFDPFTLIPSYTSTPISMKFGA